MNTWIPLNRNVSPTKAATDMAAALGSNAINLGQGREIDEPKGEIGSILMGRIRPSSKYNTGVGGNEKLREIAARWVRSFIGIPATKETTFVLQQLGRQGLNLAFQMAAIKGRSNRPGKPLYMLAGNYGWPMVGESANGHGLQVIGYQANSVSSEIGTPNATLGKQLDYQILRHDPVAVYFNYPHNATGTHIDEDDNKTAMRVLEIRNKNHSEIIRIDDNPYFMAGLEDGDGHGHRPRLNTGYYKVLSAQSYMKWVHVLSFSKALATANTGLTIMVTHPALADMMRQMLTPSVGLAYSESFFDSVAEILLPKHDEEVLAHFAGLRDKYEKNRAILQRVFGNAVVPGGASMTSLVKLPAALAGREMLCSDGEKRTIRDTNDVVEILANAAGVVVVNNGNNLAGDDGHIRFAQAQHKEPFEEGVTRAHQWLQAIENSPVLA